MVELILGHLKNVGRSMNKLSNEYYYINIIVTL